MFYAPQFLSRNAVLMAALLLANGAAMVQAEPPKRERPTFAISGLVNDHDAPNWTFALSAVERNAARPAQGAFVACLEDAAGPIRLEARCRRVRRSRGVLILRGTGNVDLGDSSEPVHSWSATIAETPAGTEVTLRFRSPTLDQVTRQGIVELGGALQKDNLPLGTSEAAVHCAAGTNTEGDWMSFQFGAFFGSNFEDGFGNFSASVDAADYPDVESIEGEITGSSVEFGGDLVFTFEGTALVYLSEGEPLEATFRLVHRVPFFGLPGIDGLTTLEVLDLTANSPLACIFNPIRSSGGPLGLLIDGDAT